MEAIVLHRLVVIIVAALLQLLSHGSEAFSCGRRCSRPRQSSSWSLNSHDRNDRSQHSQRSPNNKVATIAHNPTTCHPLLRRGVLVKTAEVLSASTIALLVNPSSSSSTPTSSLPSDRVYLRGTVTLQPGQSIPSSSEAALYITVRPNVPDDAPRAILDGTRGKSPPVLSARFPIVSSTTEGGKFFPFEFQLTQQNLTPEGALQLPTTTTAETEVGDGSTMLWWEKNGKDLIVSARLDTDGVASTRDPEDLVGRGISSHSSERTNVVSIELRGRGMFGKSVTARK